MEGELSNFPTSDRLTGWDKAWGKNRKYAERSGEYTVEDIKSAIDRGTRRCFFINLFPSPKSLITSVKMVPKKLDLSGA